ncbi:MAG: hypothetical protein VXA34_11235, partial [Gammaproteobacteria bacterium]
TLVSLDLNVCFVVRRCLRSAESARGNRLQGPLSVHYLMSAIKAALHWSLLIAHCSLLTGLWLQCPPPLDPIPRRLLDPFCGAVELTPLEPE